MFAISVENLTLAETGTKPLNKEMSQNNNIGTSGQKTVRKGKRAQQYVHSVTLVT